MCTYFKTETDVAQNLIDDFFLNLTVSGPFIGTILSEKKCRGMGLIPKKPKFCKQNLTKERKPSPVVILEHAIFYNVFISVLAAKNHKKFRTRCLVH